MGRRGLSASKSGVDLIISKESYVSFLVPKRGENRLITIIFPDLPTRGWVVTKKQGMVSLSYWQSKTHLFIIQIPELGRDWVHSEAVQLTESSPIERVKYFPSLWKMQINLSSTWIDFYHLTFIMISLSHDTWQKNIILLYATWGLQPRRVINSIAYTITSACRIGWRMIWNSWRSSPVITCVYNHIWSLIVYSIRSVLVDIVAYQYG